ncbi:MAG: hypothetical protein M3Z09_01455 [Acidobacteriota bacterium]|nr:hypothetical protein [Acidobacteriota bacterium]
MDEARRIRPGVYIFFFALITAVVFLIHAPLFRLRFYWDEVGQFVPASLDLFQFGAWIPFTTVPNIHPPGVMAYLAGFWHLSGYSVVATRVAMLLLGSLGALFTFLLAIEMGRETPGLPAFTALLFLVLSPLFVAQSMMAQLDMPAMVFTTLGLLLFLQNRMRSAALACVALVMAKETGLALPALFGFLLLRERRWREALLFTAPLAPLAVWLFALHRATGHWGGNASFEQYNAFYSLHPVRFGLALARRFYYLFVGSGHWVGTAAVVWVWRHTRLFRTRAWGVAGLFAAAHILLISAFGGAVLERYLLPLLPLLYIAFAAGLAAVPGAWRLVGTAMLTVMLIAANFLNPLYPFPWENNLGFASFVTLDQKAADYVADRYPGAVIATMFPLAGVLRRPDFGYVPHAMKIRETEDFSLKSLRDLEKNPPDALVVYSTTWDPLHLLENRWVRAFLVKYYGYERQATASEIVKMLPMHSAARWTMAGQWVEVFESDSYRPQEIVVKGLAGAEGRETGVLVENVDLREARRSQ